MSMTRMMMHFQMKKCEPRNVLCALRHFLHRGMSTALTCQLKSLLPRRKLNCKFDSLSHKDGLAVDTPVSFCMILISLLFVTYRRSLHVATC